MESDMREDRNKAVERRTSLQTVGNMPVTDRPRTSYELAMDNLDSEIAQADELFSVLVDKIRPVLRDDDAKLDAGESPSPSYSSQAARDLQNRVTRLQRLRYSISAVLDLMDL